MHSGIRVAALAVAGGVPISQTVRDPVAGWGLTFEDLGMHKLKGVPADWRVFRTILN